MDDVLEKGLVSRASRCSAGDTGISEDDIKLPEIPGEG